MSYTYPAPPVTVTQGGTAYEVHQFLKSPTLIARRLRTVLEQRYIADYLLSGRFNAVGGAILYETGEEIFPADDPRAVTPGGEYPLTVMTGGELAAAKTVKWGRDSKVTDEAIARLFMNPVERAFQKLANGSVKFVDSVALAAIISKLTQTSPAGGAWTDGGQIIEDVLVAKANVVALNEGFDPNVVTLDDIQYAKVIARMIKDGLLPREAGNPIQAGDFPNILGLTWTATPNKPGTDPILVDNTQLGGMADENLQSPGYTRGPSGIGVEVKSIREDDTDQYRLRARRVTVPVILEPLAGIRITGTEL